MLHAIYNQLKAYLYNNLYMIQVIHLIFDLRLTLRGCLEVCEQLTFSWLVLPRPIS
jgi:hypothetical protein